MLKKNSTSRSSRSNSARSVSGPLNLAQDNVFRKWNSISPSMRWGRPMSASMPNLDSPSRVTATLTVEHVILMCIQLRQYRWVSMLRAYFMASEATGQVHRQETESGFRDAQIALSVGHKITAALKKSRLMIQWVINQSCAHWSQQKALLVEDSHQAVRVREMDELSAMMQRLQSLSGMVWERDDLERDRAVVRDGGGVVELIKTVIASVLSRYPGLFYEVGEMRGADGSSSHVNTNYVVLYPYYLNAASFNEMDSSKRAAGLLQQKLCCVVDLLSLTAMSAVAFRRLYGRVTDVKQDESEHLSMASTEFNRY